MKKTKTATKTQAKAQAKLKTALKSIKKPGPQGHPVSNRAAVTRGAKLPPPSPLYPALDPFKTHMLPVGQGHVLYVAEYGNPQGLPAVVLHGGPGSGFSPNAPRRFNPATYRVICFDQRGAGKSTPTGSIQHNTTQHLVADVEVLRTHLKIENWLVYGTSWGSTLGLAYAQAYPKRVNALVLGGIFMATKEELDWFSSPHGAMRLYPNQIRELKLLLGNPHPSRFFEALHSTINGPDKQKAQAAARQWSLVECLLAVPTPSMAEIEAELASPSMLPRAQIEISYIAQGCYLKPDQLLKNAHRLRQIPLTIIQGQLDFVTPPAAAHALHAALPHSQLLLIPTAGHVGNEDMEKARLQTLNTHATQAKSL